MSEEKRLTAEEKRQIAQKHFEYWFERASNFLEKFKLIFSKEKFTDAAFDLHQVTESCYKGILLVFTNYTPREHFLEILGKEAEKCSPEFKDIFQKETKEY